MVSLRPRSAVRDFRAYGNRLAELARATIYRIASVQLKSRIALFISHFALPLIDLIQFYLLNFTEKRKERERGREDMFDNLIEFERYKQCRLPRDALTS